MYVQMNLIRFTLIDHFSLFLFQTYIWIIVVLKHSYSSQVFNFLSTYNRLTFSIHDSVFEIRSTMQMELIQICLTTDIVFLMHFTMKHQTKILACIKSKSIDFYFIWQKCSVPEHWIFTHTHLYKLFCNCLCIDLLVYYKVVDHICLSFSDYVWLMW